MLNVDTHSSLAHSESLDSFGILPSGDSGNHTFTDDFPSYRSSFIKDVPATYEKTAGKPSLVQRVSGLETG
jgi:hypothetical protein